MVPLPNDTLAVCLTTKVKEEESKDKDSVSVPEEKEVYTLVKYTFRGERLFEGMLDDIPSGMAKVTLNGTICLAMCYR